MCGIAGLITGSKIEYEPIGKMAESMRHRGPDDMGYYCDGQIGLCQTRLSIMDIENGRQPVGNEDGAIIVVFNGEIFNHRELRYNLNESGHIIKSNCDAAILPHMYEEYGTGMFEKLNGQFAIAIWDGKRKLLILGRDRIGEKPLYYYQEGNVFCFASEIKALFNSGYVNAKISPKGLGQVFTYWTTLSDRSVFEGVNALPPGHYALFNGREVKIEQYWRLEYQNGNHGRGIDEYVEELENILVSSVKKRMEADIPVAAYLSGGLDSSLIAAIAAKETKKLKTYSITFEDGSYDESPYQEIMSNYLDTEHQKIEFSATDIPLLLRTAVYHTETPFLRIGVFPMLQLSKFVGADNTKVVVSGEGADELFGGYDIFLEAKIRDFCAKYPDSKYRKILYSRINKFVKGLNDQPINSLSMYYESVGNQRDFSSHISRWRLSSYSKQFFTKEYRAQMEDNIYEEIRTIVPDSFGNWTSVQKAQFIEISTFLTNYLLASQGDRVSMASGVECRYPFLDAELLEFAFSLPDKIKISGLKEKYILKRLAKKYLPAEITLRKKYPYRAPIDITALLKDSYTKEITSYDMLERFGVFDSNAVNKFISSLSKKNSMSERDTMLFMGILTTQTLSDLFVFGRKG